MSKSGARSEGEPQLNILEIANDQFRMAVTPDLGGSIVHLVWTPTGASSEAPVAFDLLRRGAREDVASRNPSRLASFVMVPFANRVDGGRIPLASGLGAEHVYVPINRPTQKAAIHGFGRLSPWRIVEIRPTSLTLVQRFREADNPYDYEAVQTFVVSETRAECAVRVTNRAARAMPFGIGFHPWFQRTPGATLTLGAEHVFRMDDRDMPLAAIGPATVFGDHRIHGRHSMTIAARTPFDTPVGGWPGVATITWPEWGVALDVCGEGALKLAHVFSPSQPEVFCVEPVSHIPDVVNRRHLATYGDMTMLAPGASLEGAMTLTPRRLASADTS